MLENSFRVKKYLESYFRSRPSEPYGDPTISHSQVWVTIDAESALASLFRRF